MSRLADDRPRVTVVIPAYNVERYLATALDSVLAQTVTDWECFVVDDGSTDGTPRVAEGYAERDPRIRLLRQPNLGVAAARNAGIEAGCGELVAPLDADDVWVPEKLDRQIATLEARPELVACGCYMDFVDEELTGLLLSWKELEEKVIAARHPSQIRGYPDVIDPDTVIVGLVPPGGSSGIVIRRRAFDRAGLFDTRFRYSEDWDMWYRLSRLGPIVTVPEVLIRVRRHNWDGKHDFLLRGETQLMLADKIAGMEPTAYQRRQLKGMRYFGWEWLFIGHVQHRSYGRALATGLRLVAHNPVAALSRARTIWRTIHDSKVEM